MSTVLVGFSDKFMTDSLTHENKYIGVRSKILQVVIIERFVSNYSKVL